MKRRAIVSTALGFIALAFVFFTASYFLYRTFTTTGDQAVKAMNSEERSAFARLSSVTHEMNAAQVYQNMGQPSEDLYLLAKWNAFGGSFLSEARVYFANEHPYKIRWLKLGVFIYEKAL